MSDTHPGKPPLRLCGYCHAWQSEPCGNGCHWHPSDPTIAKLAEQQAALARRPAPDLLALAAKWQARARKLEIAAERHRTDMAYAELARTQARVFERCAKDLETMAAKGARDE